MKHPSAAAVKDDIRERLERRLGHLYVSQRLGIEMDHEAQVFGQGLFHIENLLFSPTLIEGVLRLSGLQGRRNAAKLRLRQNEIVSHRVPKAFDGFRILHLSDLHTDMNQQAIDRLLDLLPSLEYELCVLTGDYRGKKFWTVQSVPCRGGAAARGSERTCIRCFGGSRYDPHGPRSGGDGDTNAVQ